MATIPISNTDLKYADVERMAPRKSFFAKLSQIMALCGRSYFSLLKEIITLRFGVGRLSFDEYIALCLYDNTLYTQAEKNKFLGLRAMQKIWLEANYRFDFFGLINNKIATDVLLSAYGFPIMPTLAIFRDGVGRTSQFLLRSEEELRNFLTKSEYYPLFSKPIGGRQSIGTASLERYDETGKRLITTMGYGIPLDTFIAYVKNHAASGYLFQRRISPHTEIRKICGNRLATVRLLTITMQGGPKIIRACWKIPTGSNIADNFWRSGNLLAQLDIESGRVLSVIRASENGFEEITHHPDTGVLIVGTVIPNWQEVTKLVTESAKVLDEIALIGWDIAPIDGGAVIVEINETPDFKIHQLADRRGMWDETFINFLAERKQHAAEWLTASKQKQQIITELVVPPQNIKGKH